ncbi:ParB/Srx family N-terminal domain-containing protein [Pseudomonas sp. Marseille-QA0892]
MRYSIGVAAWLIAATFQAHAAEAPDGLIQVRLDQLHPTQPAIGYDQVRYKLGRYAQEPRKVFDEYCEANGQGEVVETPAGATLKDSSSFTCRDGIGTHRRDMKTVVKAPNGEWYLTDGHHTFTSLWETPSAGPDFSMWLRVTADYSDMPDMAGFWQRMEREKKVRLKDGQGKPIQAADLPAQLGFANLQDDPFRSLVYFTRGAAYAKPRTEDVVPEFLEFYWADWLRPQISLGDYDLNSQAGYGQAVEAASQLMVGLDEDAPVGDSGFTAQALGRFEEINRKAMEKTLNGKVAYSLAYKQAH